MPLVTDITVEEPEEGGPDLGVSPAELRRYANEKHRERMAQIRDADAEVPDVKTLTSLDDG